jgi:outer membrane protein assembly factor BamA
MIRPLLVTLLLSGFFSFGISQTSIVIEHIELCGNKRTRDEILFRELTIRVGDTIPSEALQDLITLNEYRLLNTGLFLRASLQTAPSGDVPGHIGIDIVVKEVLYVVPIPILEFADRNFNVWWVDQKRALDRINYGIDIVHSNLTGRRDVLGVLLQDGYTRKVELDYIIPFINQNQTIGLEGNVLYTRNQEVIYKTINNRQQFFRSEDMFLFHRFRSRVGVVYRPGLWTSHRVTLTFRDYRTESYVQDFLNPDFFGDGRQRQRMVSLRYEWTLDERDILPYPIRGQFVQIGATKDGVGLFRDRDVLFLDGHFARYRPWSDKWSTGAEVYARWFVTRAKQAFYQNKALGYKDLYIRGYEYYVIDGMDFVLLKSAVRYELLNAHIRTFGPFGIEALKRIPIRIYLTANLDGGWVNEPYFSESNPLVNRWLTGGGIGIDCVVLYNKLVRLEFSANDLGEKGVFLHYQFQF